MPEMTNPMNALTELQIALGDRIVCKRPNFTAYTLSSS